jgi:glycosyltransferase involved in cell wall biosynthesis
MKILKLCYEFPPVGGGGGRAANGLARELVRAGHEVDLVTMRFRGLPRFQEIAGIRVHRVPCLRLREFVCSPPEMMTYLAAALPLAWRLDRARRYDINHTEFIFPDGILAWRLWRATGLPYVITTHGSDVPGYNPDRFQLAHRLLSPLWNRVIDGARAVILPSASIEGLFKARRPDAPSVSISYGMTLKYSASGKRLERILVVTRMLERKGVQYLLRALVGWNSTHEVHIVGDGPYLPALRELAAELDVSVRFWGWLDNDSPQLRDLFESSSIFVLTSEMENFPVSLLEAMTAGLAIITTRDTGCAEVVGDAALLVPPRDPDAIRSALKELVRNPEIRADLGRRARERVERCFSWRETARRHVELYAPHARHG